MTKADRSKLTQAFDIDRHVGARIRHRRIVLGLPQQHMADLLGVSSHQANRYERGFNRMTAAFLYKIARTLDVDFNYFYNGLEERLADSDPNVRMMLELARNFLAIAEPRHQAALVAISGLMAADDVGDGKGE